MKPNLEQAVSALKSGQRTRARQLLINIVREDPKHAPAWYVLSFVVDELQHKIDCLQRVVKYAPAHNKAQALLQELELSNHGDSSNPDDQLVLDAESPTKPNIRDAQPAEHHIIHNRIYETSSILAAVTPTDRRQPLFRGPFSIRDSRCIWQLSDPGVKEPYKKPDVLRFLIEDLARFPIITSPHQETLLGIQLQAAPRLAVVLADWKSQKDTITCTQFLCQELLATWGHFEQEYIKTDLQLPKLEIWAAELNVARRDVYTVKRSRILRFIRRVQALPDKAIVESLLGMVYQIVEIMAIFPGDTLAQLARYIGTHQCLPSCAQLVDWLPAECVTLEQLAANRTKQTQHVLTNGYLRYALRIAQGYVGQGIDYEDLVQAGFIGLSRAASKFDYRVQARFGTYATSWIWQAVGRELADQGRTIRLPVHIQENLRKWRIACDLYDDGLQDSILNPLVLLHAGLLEQADYEQVTKMMGDDCDLPPGVADRYEQAIDKASKLRANDVQFLSLSEVHFIIPEESNDVIESVEELVPDENASVETAIDRPFVRQLIEDHIFPFLTDREREVLMLRCGWEDGQERTLEEVGAQYDLTRERIRQIEAKAHKKLGNRLALGLLPNFQELIIEEELSPSWQSNVQLIFPSSERYKDADSTDLSRLNSLLSQLPRSDWVQGRSGIQNGKRQEQLVAALEQLAVPAHVSEIAEQLNSVVEGKELEDPHIYSLLVRDEETFILLGQGIFSLVKWERNREKEPFPILPCCPMPLPDPPDYEDAFFESVLVGQAALAQGLTADQFLRQMFKWAEEEPEIPNWFAQTVLSAYYLVDLIPYTFYFGGDNPILRCTLPASSIQELRYHCLSSLTKRLAAMPEFWWLFQQNQPARPADLGEQFTDIHPFGLDDVLQRLRLLASLGAAQKFKYGEYRLTPLGEACANRWKREVVVETTVASEPTLLHNFADFIEW